LPELPAELLDGRPEVVRARIVVPDGICQAIRRVLIGLRFQLAMYILQIIVEIFDRKTKALKKRLDPRNIDLDREAELRPRVLDDPRDVTAVPRHGMGKTDVANVCLSILGDIVRAITN
jgi:hypothetical protein